ncbi:MAG: signal peptidase I [Dethiobacter sp.]|jgi:signal peptidase I|nr:signal peptidase I [Dethiobacter sp.]
MRKILLAAVFFSIASYVFFALSGLAPLPPDFNRYSLLTVKTGSMKPALSTNAVIVVDKQRNTLFNTGDIITFHAGDGRLITHRIVAAGFDGDVYYITKGDANRSSDLQPVRRYDIFGRVIFVTPAFLALFIHFLRSPAALYTLLGLFLIMLVRSASALRS